MLVFLVTFLRPLIPYILGAIALLGAIGYIVYSARQDARKDVKLEQVEQEKKVLDNVLKKDDRNRKRINADPDILRNDGYRRE